jgi:hypothetical protein
MHLVITETIALECHNGSSNIAGIFILMTILQKAYSSYCKSNALTTVYAPHTPTLTPSCNDCIYPTLLPRFILHKYAPTAPMYPS